MDDIFEVKHGILIDIKNELFHDSFNFTETALEEPTIIDKLQNLIFSTDIIQIGYKDEECDEFDNGHIFSFCEHLENIIIPSNVIAIGRGVFSYCRALKSVIIADSVKSIGSNAFQGCPNLKSVVMPDNLIAIEYRTFANCKNLRNIVIPNKITKIGEDVIIVNAEDCFPKGKCGKKHNDKDDGCCNT